ncbi:hypothetical protein Pmani_034454 [Petrolisthes manimaculis]|uniref:Uncharacterized protein n=1 Tax=Petrolisthes manimaculis TaxID=1843537 RepID=A0AAE1NPV5_9EUCA|nr:hypothetical protein Pmani_034454 [Petrolisthes manimaculis]
MVHDQDEQIEKQLGWCPLQGTNCATLGGKCYHERIMPMVKCKGVVNNTPNICGIDANECYCCVEYDIDGQLTNTNQCTQTMECRQGGADHGKCVADVDYYLDLETTYVSKLQCEEPHCSCLHQCQEESICRDFDGHCFLNDVTNCGMGYTMLPGCGYFQLDSGRGYNLAKKGMEENEEK